MIDSGLKRFIELKITKGTVSYTAMHRYHRQTLLPTIGEAGQARLAEAHVFVAGCGALGCVVADALARAGVGQLTIIDRDIVELTNLQRQILYVENDAATQMPKAEAARRRLQAINSEIQVNAVIDDLNPGNVERLVSDDVQVLVDGLDNFETRYLLNDVSVRHGIPYVYGGAVATNGMTATFLPHQPATVTWRNSARWDEESQATPCLRCIFPEAPPAGASPTCDTAGVLGPLISVIGALEAAEVIKILVGDYAAINRNLVMLDLWRNESRSLNMQGARATNDCPCCKDAQFEYLQGQRTGSATSLCGRNSVQIIPAQTLNQGGAFDYSAVATRLEKDFAATRSEFMLKVVLPESDGGFDLTIFPNGRAVVTGTDDPALARSIYARYVGA